MCSFSFLSRLVEQDEADLEDGEIHDPTASKTQTIDEEQNGTSTEKSHCRYFLQGRCHWGSNCKYIHPTNETNKGRSSFAPSMDRSFFLSVAENSLTNKTDPSPPNSAGLTPTNHWISPQPIAMVSRQTSMTIRETSPRFRMPISFSIQ